MVAGLVRLFCLISSVLLTGVTSLKCQTCFVTRGVCRNEEMTLMECEQDQTHCLSLSFLVTFTSPPLSYTAKTCAKVKECNEGSYSITSEGGKYIQMNVFCCQSNGCNAMPHLLTSRDELKPNGLACSGSYTRHGEPLQPAQQILCLGRETRCVNVNFTMNTFGAIEEGGFLQGCATPDVCSYPEGETEFANGLLKFNVTKDCNTMPLPLDNDFLFM